MNKRRKRNNNIRKKTPNKNKTVQNYLSNVSSMVGKKEIEI